MSALLTRDISRVALDMPEPFGTFSDISPTGKSGRTGETHNLREVHGRNLFVVDVIKVDVPEERMLLDVLGVGLSRTQSSDRVSVQQLQS